MIRLHGAEPEITHIHTTSCLNIQQHHKTSSYADTRLWQINILRVGLQRIGDIYSEQVTVVRHNSVEKRTCEVSEGEQRQMTVDGVVFFSSLMAYYL